jgi:hypothetical protein
LSFKKAKKYDIAWSYRAAISDKFCVFMHTKIKQTNKQKNINKTNQKKPNKNKKLKKRHFFLYIRRSRKYIICEFYILDKRYKGFLKDRNPEPDDRRPGRRRIMVIIWSKKFLT